MSVENLIKQITQEEFNSLRENGNQNCFEVKLFESDNFKDYRQTIYFLITVSDSKEKIKSQVKSYLDIYFQYIKSYQILYFN